MILLINYSHKWWYKALSVILVVALILAISFGAAPRAHAVGVLTITVCAAILAVMAGAGIATVVSGMTSADIQNWMTGKLNEWDAYRNDGNVFSDLIQNNLITTTVKGALAIGNGAARGISDFITWLKNDLSLADNSQTQVVEGGYFLNNIEFVLIDNFYCKSSFGYNLHFYLQNGGSFYAAKDTNNALTGYSYMAILLTDNMIENNSLIVNDRGTNTTISLSNSSSGWKFYYSGIYTNQIPDLPQYSGRLEPILYQLTSNDVMNSSGELSLDSDVINIPSVADDGQTDIIIGIDGVYPGATADEAADVIMDGVLDNTLDTTMTVTDEYVDAVEAVVINEQPISVNTDHHMIGFTNLPDFVNLNLNSIWHYVSDAVEYASGFISWFVNLLSNVPTLAIPLYMSFTLLIVLSFIRRILL